MTTTLGETNSPVELAAAAGVLAGGSGWLLWRSWPTVTAWAHNHHLLTRDPIFALPGAVPAGSGPTLVVTSAILATLILIPVAVAAAIMARRRLELPPRFYATGIWACTAITLLWVLLIFVAGAHQWLAVLLSALLTSLVVAATDHRLMTGLSRRNTTRLLAARTAPHLGFPDAEYAKAITDIDWADDQPATVTFAHRSKMTKTIPAEIAEILGQCLDVSYQVRHDIPQDVLIATRTTKASTANEPHNIAQLRKDVASNEMFGENATVAGIVVSRTDAGKIVAFDVEHDISRKLVDTPRPRSLERRLGLLVGGGRWRASRWDWQAGTVHFSLRREFPPMILPPRPQPVITTAPTTPAETTTARTQVIANYTKTEFPYGIDEDGTIIGWRPCLLPHTLTIGATGSGKTSVTHTIVAAATNAGWPVIIIDFKGIEYTQFRGWPNVTMIITSIEEAVAVIHQFYEEMLRRYRAVELSPAKLNELMPFLIVIDEYAEFIDRLKTFYANTKPAKGAPRNCPTLDEIDSLMRLARTSRMHVYTSLQRPDAKIMGDSTASRDQFSHRISVGPLTTQGATMLWNNAMVGRTIPPGIRGRATAKNPAGDFVEIQCFYTPNPGNAHDAAHPQLRQSFADLRPPAALWDRQVVAYPTGDEEDFFDFQRLEIFTASQRPDLDPLSDEYCPPEADAALADYDVSSGYLGTDPLENRHTPTTTSDPATPLEDTAGPRLHLVSSADEDPREFRWEDAYDNPIETAVSNLTHGDMIHLGDQTGDEERWVMVDGEPEPVNDSTTQLFWRDVMSGEEGESIVDTDTTVLRRPERELEMV